MKKTRVLLLTCLFLCILLNANTGNFVDAQSNPIFEIRQIGQLETSGWAANVLVQDDTAFVADSEGGLVIINVTDPANPFQISVFDEDIDHIHGIDVHENLVYIADYTDGFKILDITDLEHPTQLGRFHDGGEVGAFTIFEDLAFIADFEDGLEIVNISDSTNPIEIVQYDTGINYIFNVEIHSDLAYVSDFISSSLKKLLILNISDLSNIEEIADYTIDGEVFSIDFVGDLAYMMCSYGGVKVYNIADPMALTEVGSYDDGGNALGMEFFENYAMIADGSDGLEFLDINDPTNITEAFHFDTVNAFCAVIVDDTIYVACAEDGLEILQILAYAPSETSLDLPVLVLLIGVPCAIVVVAIIAKLRKS